MFISRGRTVAIHDASRTPLTRLMVSPGVRHGRLVYRAPDGSILELEYLDGKPVACLLTTPHGAEIRGDACVHRLLGLLGERRGLIEVIELTPEQVRVDLDYMPSARLSQRAATTLLERLQAPRPARPAAPVRAAPARAPPRQPTPRAPERVQPTQPPPPRPPTPRPPVEARHVEEEAVRIESMLGSSGIRVSDFFDFNMAAYLVLRGSEVPVTGEAGTCLEIVAKILPPSVPTYLYCSDDNSTLRLLVDPERRSLYAMLERQGRLFFGVKALRESETVKPVRARLYILASGR